MAVSRTSNNGSSWTRYSLAASGYTYSLAVDPSNSNTVYAGGNPRLYKTTNSGGDWFNSSSGLSGIIYDIEIDRNTSSTIFAGTSAGVYKSTNSGANWSNTSCPGGNTNAVLIDPDNSDNVYAGTSSNGVYISTDGGSTWTAMNDSLDDMHVTSLGIDPGNYLFAGTNSAAMFRWELMGIEEENSEAKFVLCAMPNPFYDKTMINYSLPKVSLVEVSVYDIQGRLVKVLEKDTRSVGLHSVVWHGLDDQNNQLAPGIYFLKLTTDDQSHVQKLILMR